MLSILATVLPGILTILQKAIPDADARAKAQEEITAHLLANEATIIDAAKSVVVAEVTSESWMAKNWRPALMFLLMGLIVWFVVVAPVFGLVGATKVALAAVPPELWSLIQIGLGGYIIGRSGEKIANSVVGKK